MGKDYLIYTDVTSDLPDSFYKENNVRLLYLSYVLGGVEYSEGKTLPTKEFYAKLRGGEIAKTSQITPEIYEAAFEKTIQDGMDVLYIAFSSALSGSCGSAKVAAATLSEKYPQAKVLVVDSLCASLGEGLLVYKAVQLKKQGKSLDELAAWLEENKLHLCHMFTVDDLMHLHRGGRVSKTTAIAGSILGIKPILHVSDEGKLISIGKVRGRKQSLMALADYMGERIGSWQNPVAAISHGDCEEDAHFVRDLIAKRFGVKEFIINPVGTVIGSHSGPNTLALFFMGDKR